MIFVTVGTHEQPFDRLVKAIDELKRDQLITDDIFIQTGYSTYSPKYCEWSKFVPYADMEKKPESLLHMVVRQALLCLCRWERHLW